MREYFNCSFFKNSDIFMSTQKIKVQQKELLLEMNSVNNEEKKSFKIVDVNYECFWIKQDNWDSNKPCILIPIKDNIELLEITIKNLYEKKVVNHSNIIIIDDRSVTNIKKIVINNKLSYLRVDNQKGFNFSMLNNIAAFISYKLGCKEIILWNSDLWCVKEEHFLSLLEKHRENKSTISGSKLVYPPVENSMYKEDSDIINSNFPNMKGKWRNTIQYGGSAWVNSGGGLIPIHSNRFKHIEHHRVDCDKGESFVTGALQIINLEWYINNGGLNPSLSKNYQDADLCLKAIEQDKKIFYFGKNIYFYHDESVSLSKEGKHDLQLLSDHLLFDSIWHNKISLLVL
jgi:GT2 family glycosyltransferase